MDNYPLPRIENLFIKLNLQKDLANAYQQVFLEEKSKWLTTINIHKGLFAYNRLPFGGANAHVTVPCVMKKTLSECYSTDLHICKTGLA